jgi:hypothetical protein
MQQESPHGHLRRKFSAAEDMKLREVVEEFGSTDWACVAAHMAPRNARQCRERWTNYLNPSRVNAPWTAAEDSLLEQKFGEFGTKWQSIADHFPGRSKNDIKNHWIAKQKNLLTVSVDTERRSFQGVSTWRTHVLHLERVPMREPISKPPRDPVIKLGSISSFLNEETQSMERIGDVPRHRLIKIV